MPKAFLARTKNRKRHDGEKDNDDSDLDVEEKSENEEDKQTEASRMKSGSKVMVAERNDEEADNEEPPVVVLYDTEGSLGARAFVCIYCSKNFVTRYQLKRHLLTHSGKRQHVCSICDAAFVLSSSLWHHMQTHNTKKSHICVECGQAFSRSTGLRLHRKTHTNSKDHVCNICGKAFHQKGNLKAHINAHKGIRPYRCTECGQSYSQLSNMKRHMWTHHRQKKVFACLLCGAAFEKCKELRLHEQASHKSVAPDPPRTGPGLPGIQLMLHRDAQPGLHTNWHDLLPSITPLPTSTSRPDGNRDLEGGVCTAKQKPCLVTSNSRTTDALMACCLVPDADNEKNPPREQTINIVKDVMLSHTKQNKVTCVDSTASLNVSYQCKPNINGRLIFGEMMHKSPNRIDSSEGHLQKRESLISGDRIQNNQIQNCRKQRHCDTVKLTQDHVQANYAAGVRTQTKDLSVKSAQNSFQCSKREQLSTDTYSRLQSETTAQNGRANTNGTASITEPNVSMVTVTGSFMTSVKSHIPGAATCSVSQQRLKLPCATCLAVTMETQTSSSCEMTSPVCSQTCRSGGMMVEPSLAIEKPRSFKTKHQPMDLQASTPKRPDQPITTHPRTEISQCLKVDPSKSLTKTAATAVTDVLSVVSSCCLGNRHGSPSTPLQAGSLPLLQGMVPLYLSVTSYGTYQGQNGQQAEDPDFVPHDKDTAVPATRNHFQRNPLSLLKPSSLESFFSSQCLGDPVAPPFSQPVPLYAVMDPFHLCKKDSHRHSNRTAASEMVAMATVQSDCAEDKPIRKPPLGREMPTANEEDAAKADELKHFMSNTLTADGVQSPGTTEAAFSEVTLTAITDPDSERPRASAQSGTLPADGVVLVPNCRDLPRDRTMPDQRVVPLIGGMAPTSSGASSQCAVSSVSGPSLSQSVTTFNDVQSGRSKEAQSVGTFEQSSTSLTSSAQLSVRNSSTKDAESIVPGRASQAYKHPPPSSDGVKHACPNRTRKVMVALETANTSSMSSVSSSSNSACRPSVSTDTTNGCTDLPDISSMLQTLNSQMLKCTKLLSTDCAEVSSNSSSNNKRSTKHDATRTNWHSRSQFRCLPGSKDITMTMYTPDSCVPTEFIIRGDRKSPVTATQDKRDEPRPALSGHGERTGHAGQGTCSQRMENIKTKKNHPFSWELPLGNSTTQNVCVMRTLNKKAEMKSLQTVTMSAVGQKPKPILISDCMSHFKLSDI